VSDAEVEAILKVQEILGSLEPDAAQRVARWASEKFGGGPIARAGEAAGAASPVAVDEFEDVADLFHAVSPTTESDKALTAAYWAQVCQGLSFFEGYRVNTELKNLGHGLSNVTRALDSLINQKPALVIQTRKSGTSKQARKQYKVTRAGILRIESLIKSESADE